MLSWAEVLEDNGRRLPVDTVFDQNGEEYTAKEVRADYGEYIKKHNDDIAAIARRVNAVLEHLLRAITLLEQSSRTGTSSQSNATPPKPQTLALRSKDDGQPPLDALKALSLVLSNISLDRSS